MIKGTESKNIIAQKILEMFPNSFQYDKEIRIPMQENGEIIQIKCALTCAKTNVNEGNENEIPNIDNAPIESKNTEISQEELDNIKRLSALLNL